MRTFYLTLKYLIITLWSLFVIAPLLWALSTSFKDFNSVTGGATYIPWLQFEPSLEGWKVLVRSPAKGGVDIIEPYFNSIFVTCTASLISIIWVHSRHMRCRDLNSKQVLLKITTLHSFLFLKGLCRLLFYPYRFS